MHDFYLTKFFQRLLFGKHGNGSILLMVLVFLLNLALVMGVDFGFIHNIPLPETTFTPTNTHRIYPDFRDSFDGEILDMDGEKGGGYYVLYRDTSGDTHVIKLEGSGIFFRYHWNEGSRITIPAEEDPFTYDEGNKVYFLRFTVSNDRFEDFSEREFQLFSGNIADRLLGVHMVIALLMLIVEGYILNKIRGKE